MEWIIFLVLAPIFLIIMSNGRKKQECEKWNAQYANYVKRCKSKGETPKSQSEYERDEKREIEKMQREITASRVAKQRQTASVTKRAIVGGIIAGAPGAVIGAASAIDENNKQNKSDTN